MGVVRFVVITNLLAMIVQFQPAPYSFADTTKHLFTIVSTGDVVPATITTVFGGTIDNGPPTSPPGTLRKTAVAVGKDILVWKNSTNGGVYDYWQLDAGAAATAVTTITDAIEADQTLLVLAADGTEYTGS